MGKNSAFITLMLAGSISLNSISWAVTPVNTMNDGRIIQGGTFYNTSNSQTTFINSHSGDLWLQSGTNVRGLEVNSAGILTNNGGNIQLYAPKSVVRLDGNIDVSGIINGQGAYLGNGGKVQVNASYLYQNGNITALGVQGGHVNINVNSTTFGPQAKIDTSGTLDGAGGIIRINANGAVDIKSGALLQTTGGSPLPGIDTSVIEITGKLVNNAGIISANGINTSDADPKNASPGGTIRIVANPGNIPLYPMAKVISRSTVFTTLESKNQINNLQGLTQFVLNKIRNLNIISANGGNYDSGNTSIGRSGGNGGTISLTASRGVVNEKQSLITSRGGDGSQGGNGGEIIILSKNCKDLSTNNGVIQADGGSSPAPFGSAGNGGHIIVLNFHNAGMTEADGGSANSVDGALGGSGGTITATNASNVSTIEAKGGNATAVIGASGGSGGYITLNNFTNSQPIAHAALVSVNGGKGSGQLGTSGGNGGQITGSHVINTDKIEANGGLFLGGSGRGGQGGKMTFTKLSNTGLLTANGGDTAAIVSGTLTGGDGGSIVGKQVSNTGTAQVLGGISGTSPSLNGKDGTIIGF